MTIMKNPLIKNNTERTSVFKKILLSIMERISVITFQRGRSIKGSMTVEAAVILPLLLFFFLHIMSAVEMLRLHVKLTFAL